MKKKGVKKRKSVSRSRKSSNNLLSKRNVVIIVVALIVAYFLFSYSGDDYDSNDGELNSVRTSLKAFFIRLFGLGGGCSEDTDCSDGKFCDKLTAVCSVNKVEFGGFTD